MVTQTMTTQTLTSQTLTTSVPTATVTTPISSELSVAQFSHCFDIFSQKGYAATTLDDIAAGLGVGTAVLMHRYPTKQSLFGAMITGMTEHDLQGFRAYVSQGETQRQRLERTLEYIHQAGDYFYQQMKLFIGFYDQQQAGIEPPDSTLVGVSDDIDAALVELTSLPSEVREMLLSFMDGMNYARVYGAPLDQVQQCRLFTEMVFLYLEKKS
jgi:AcrR family transcriptional regulator